MPRSTTDIINTAVMTSKDRHPARPKMARPKPAFVVTSLNSKRRDPAMITGSPTSTNVRERRQVSSGETFRVRSSPDVLQVQPGRRLPTQVQGLTFNNGNAIKPITGRVAPNRAMNQGQVTRPVFVAIPSLKRELAKPTKEQKTLPRFSVEQTDDGQADVIATKAMSQSASAVPKAARSALSVLKSAQGPPPNRKPTNTIEVQETVPKTNSGHDNQVVTTKWTSRSVSLQPTIPKAELSAIISNSVKGPTRDGKPTKAIDVQKTLPAAVRHRVPSVGQSLFEKTSGSVKSAKTMKNPKEGKPMGGYPGSARACAGNELAPRPSCVPRSRVSLSSFSTTETSTQQPSAPVKVSRIDVRPQKLGVDRKKPSDVRVKIGTSKMVVENKEPLVVGDHVPMRIPTPTRPSPTLSPSLSSFPSQSWIVVGNGAISTVGNTPQSIITVPINTSQSAESNFISPFSAVSSSVTAVESPASAANSDAGSSIVVKPEVTHTPAVTLEAIISRNPETRREVNRLRMLKKVNGGGLTAFHSDLGRILSVRAMTCAAKTGIAGPRDISQHLTCKPERTATSPSSTVPSSAEVKVNVSDTGHGGTRMAVCDAVDITRTLLSSLETATKPGTELLAVASEANALRIGNEPIIPSPDEYANVSRNRETREEINVLRMRRKVESSRAFHADLERIFSLRAMTVAAVAKIGKSGSDSASRV